MSAASGVARSPSSAAAASTESALRESISTRAPAATSSAAIARPIPRLAPPTTNDLSCSSIGRAPYSRTFREVDQLTWRSALVRAVLVVALFVGLGYLAVRLVPG